MDNGGLCDSSDTGPNLRSNDRDARCVAVAVVGSFYVGRGMRSQEWKLSLVRERLLERQRLYARFIAEADRNLLLVLSGKAPCRQCNAAARDLR